jgi:hypothetical protein
VDREPRRPAHGDLLRRGHVKASIEDPERQPSRSFRTNSSGVVKPGVGSAYAWTYRDANGDWSGADLPSALAGPDSGSWKFSEPQPAS